MVVPRIGRVVGKKSRNILFAVSKADDQVEDIVDVDVLVQRFQDDAALVEEAGCYVKSHGQRRDPDAPTAGRGEA